MPSPLAARAAKILKTIRYATLATVTDDGRPWNSPVARMLDDNLIIYWISDKGGQHSRNIANNGRVFIVVYDSTVPHGVGEGVFIEASAIAVSDISTIRTIQKLEDWSGSDVPEDFIGDSVRSVYKAEPRRVWVNEDVTENGKFIKDIRVEIPIDEIKAIMRHG